LFPHPINPMKARPTKAPKIPRTTAYAIRTQKSRVCTSDGAGGIAGAGLGGALTDESLTV